MPLAIRGAERIDVIRLLSVACVPLAAAIAMAAGLLALGGATEMVAAAGGKGLFLLGFVKFCYLGVAMAHLAGALAERMGDALPAGTWFDDPEENRPRGRDPDPVWRVFPNHLDGAAIAFAVTVACGALA